MPLRDDVVDAREGAATSLGELSDAWLVGRARELQVIGQHSDPQGRDATRREADNLLTEARRRGHPRMLGQLLCCCATLRLCTPGMAEQAVPLLDELLTHARRHRLDVLRADAHALRGRLALLDGNEDNALNQAAEALVILDDDLVPDAALGRRSWERLLATSLIDIGLVLTQLGVFDIADEVMARAHHRIRESGGPHEIATHLINRCRMLLGWGLRLERIGKQDDADGRFSTAAQIAVAVDGPWQESLFPRVPGRKAAEQMPVLAAACALAEPNGSHIDKLEEVSDPALELPVQETIIIAIALARCYDSAERPDEATKVLFETRQRVCEDISEPSLRISLVREYARRARLDPDNAAVAVEEYAQELESELWTMRASRSATLMARLDRQRLNRQHHAITRQAMHDPLTGLPNRRALDAKLESMLREPESQPLSVALVDLDGFKEVNDQLSHAEGDEVLRVIARTLSDTLRADDLVSRYGGDEFVVLLPGVELEAAESALTRTVNAVSRLPGSLSRGVTLSIGVVAMLPQESGSEVLARSDTAMYQSKRRGGNQVAAMSGDAHHGDPAEPPAWIPPESEQ
ncbi:diguanylate cyclase (GGDEF) domain-containing protein [Actinopolyspora mzabensis]|uniref:Diguanylate cyclase (GGDEF) domain-containing protein n=1 Tax=Actinopolyspora mzabensis TaxID=995066 RepID=A0A1G8VMM7_ACTMZ|nr:GGDEF domain-containing protein [Actinopolyspora mzabensis]SDJ67316.1 diguanylate cyclase (GGDEF) domain-containing protein [Actinopolyspora mzabensis]